VTEHLTDGWEPDQPVADTLLRQFVFNLAAFHEVPAAAGAGCCAATSSPPPTSADRRNRGAAGLGCVGSLFVEAGVAASRSG
jgi:hypothetical protein